MTTGLSYDGSVVGTTSFISQIATLAVVPVNDPNFVIILPQAITYAENRIYRDLDLLTASDVKTYLLSSGQRKLDISGGLSNFPFVVTEQINILTPSTETNPDSATATRNPCIPATKEFLDQVYGSAAVAYRGVPKYYAPFDDNVFLLGPAPDANYTVEIVGTSHPASMSLTNQTTFISLYLPDLFIMATMIYISGYQRNFSSTAANDPQMPVNYETQYRTLLKGADEEEARKSYTSSGWSSFEKAEFATPNRE